MWHRHRWQEQGRYFIAPGLGFKADSISSADMRRLVEGVTVVELRCEVCGDLTTRELPGRAPLDGRELVEARRG